jgi:acyl-CoA synthetase (AMP-forming)/AMP-acid ligase II
MYYIVETDFPDDKPLPLGNPFPNERVLLLDENDKQISEADIPGEICVIGSCLALGYYDNPSQTHAAFCSNPLNSRWDETLYRTGDLAKYDETGALFFMGRKDFQVKHQGRRVELSEIESVLTGIEAVERVCCIHIESTDLLVAFYIGSISTVDILTTARKLLPQYMLPNLFRCIDEVPLTKNGKTDRVALLKRYTEEQRTGDK